MHNRPRSRARGLMDRDTIKRSLYWVEKLEKPEVLSLHVFGEPLLHPRFDEIALEFSKLAPVTMSTNAVLLDEEWADRLAKIPWSWISISPWDKKAMHRASKLLHERGVTTRYPPGETHDWAGQAGSHREYADVILCEFLAEQKAVIRWNGDIATCCVSDRQEDVIGRIVQEPSEVFLRTYSLCEKCHLRM